MTRAETRRAYYERNRERLLDYQRQRRLADVEAARRRDRETHARRRERFNEEARIARATMKAADPAGLREKDRAQRERARSADPNFGRKYAPLRAAWRKANPEKVRRHSKNVVLFRKYGIRLVDYERMSEAQGHVCAICGKAETMTIRGVPAQLAVDHDHATGRVRGLLCVKCNMLIGGAHHDPAILRAAIGYLQRSA